MEPVRNEITLQARAVLSLIERQTQYLKNQIRVVIDTMLTGQVSQTSAHGSMSQRSLTYLDLERFASYWSALIPVDPEIRATLAYDIASRYEPVFETTPEIRNALGVDEDAVQAAFTRLYRAEIMNLFVQDEQLNTAHSSMSSHLDALEAAIERVFLPSGGVLFREGDPGDSMYVIASGRIRVVTGDGDHARTVAERGRYDLIGEMALLTGEPRTATLYAIRDTELWRISRTVFEELAQQYPQLMLQMTRMLSKRLKIAMKGDEKQESGSVHTIALVPASGMTETSAIAERLTQALSAYGRTYHLTGERLDALFSSGASRIAQGAAAETQLIGWLNEHELQYDFIVYEADAMLSEWTMRCIRQADRVVMVGHAADTPDLNTIEQALFNPEQFNSAIRKELVLLHPNADHYPRGTVTWLAQRSVQNHYHVALDHDDHFLRVARFLIGRPIALVLSGGSVRSFSHIGVLRAMREANIPVDAVCGTSSGAIIGAQIAMGWSDTELEARNMDFFEKANKLFDLTLPFTSLLGGKEVDKLLHRMVGDLHVEDLWLKYFCTSSDLTSFETRRHERGLLRRAIRASCSIPGLLPPVIESGHMLVDGGLTNNLPVSEMLAFIGSGTIILSNVVVEFYPDDGRFNFGDNLPFWKVVNAKFNPFSAKVLLPNIAEVVRRGAECNARSLQLQEIERADLYIRPAVDDVGFSDVKQAPRLIQTGYQISKARLAEWLNTTQAISTPASSTG